MLVLKRLFMIALLIAPLAACDSNDGPVEKLGENIDNAADDTRDAVNDAVDDAKD